VFFYGIISIKKSLRTDKFESKRIFEVCTFEN
jgi:hypothetical protein